MTFDALYREAVAHERAGRLDEAVAACDAALGQAPDDVACRLTQAAALRRLGAPMAALEVLLEAHALAPKDPVVAHLLRVAGGAGFEAPLLSEVAELFDRYAPKFDAHLGTLGYQGHVAVCEALAPWASDGPPWVLVLDLGCGTGLCGPLLRGHTDVLVGVDASSEMLSKAGERGCYDALELGDLVYAVSTRPPGSVDAVVAADVFGYLGGLEAIFAAARRALAPHGVLAFSVERGPTHPWMLSERRRARYTERYLADTANACGLAITSLDVVALRDEAASAVEGFVIAARPA